jgi:hypothetical protein
MSVVILTDMLVGIFVKQACPFIIVCMGILIVLAVFSGTKKQAVHIVVRKSLLQGLVKDLYTVMRLEPI